MPHTCAASLLSPLKGLHTGSSVHPTIANTLMPPLVPPVHPNIKPSRAPLLAILVFSWNAIEVRFIKTELSHEIHELIIDRIFESCRRPLAECQPESSRQNPAQPRFSSPGPHALA